MLYALTRRPLAYSLTSDVLLQQRELEPLLLWLLRLVGLVGLVGWEVGVAGVGCGATVSSLVW